MTKEQFERYSYKFAIEIIVKCQLEGYAFGAEI